MRLAHRERPPVEEVRFRVLRARRQQLPQRLDRIPGSPRPPVAGGWLRGDRPARSRSSAKQASSACRESAAEARPEAKPIEPGASSREHRRRRRSRNQGRCASLRAVRNQLLAQRWPWLLAAGLIVVAFLFDLRPDPPADGDWDRRPRGTAEDIARLRDRSDLNVLFILVDTLRAERLGSYGYARDTSPILDRLASSGVRFERHLGAVDLDQVLDGLALDRALPGAHRRHALRRRGSGRRRGCRRRSCARRASRPSGSGATAGSLRPSASTRASTCTSARSRRRCRRTSGARTRR